MNTGKYICLIGLLLALLFPVPASAEITFYVSPDGDKAFTIEGDDINEKASIEVTVVYNPAILANPRVTLETGSVTDVFESIPGTLTFKADQGDEPAPSFVAHLNFEKTGDSPGGVLSVKGKIIEPDGTITQSRTMPNVPIPSTSALSTADSDNEALEPNLGEPAAEDSSSALRADMAIKARKSVLQKFREFRGEQGLQAFVALFERSPRDIVVQEPSVALSDGKACISVRFEPQPRGGASPNIALSDAKLIRVRDEGEKGWTITALPNEGTWSARLIVEADEKKIEFPLIIAPPIDIPKHITEKNFVAELDRFIFERAGGDPRRRTLYEYFFTANYLASSGNKPAKTAPDQSLLASTSK